MRHLSFLTLRLGKSDKDIESEILRRLGRGEGKSDIVKDLVRRGIASRWEKKIDEILELLKHEKP